MKYIETVIVIVVEYMVECDRWSIEVEGLWLTDDGVTKMGLSPYASEIHKDAYTTRVLPQADRLILENSEKATLNIKMPFSRLTWRTTLFPEIYLLGKSLQLTVWLLLQY